MDGALLDIVGLRKAFPGVLALDEVDFNLRPGEIHALLGKNGAGKSTLISIISGMLPPDGGTVEYDGRAMPLDRLGEINVATVFQESTIFPNLTIAENIFAGNEPRGRRRALEEEATRRHLARFGLDADPQAPIASLSPAERKVVEIIRALERDCRILILDEPTAALSLNETNRLFALLRQAKGNGIGIIYISHRLEEIFQVADRVTVLRDGRVTLAGGAVGNLLIEDLVTEIVGADAVTAETGRPERPAVADTSRPLRFEARHLNHAGGRFRDLSVSVRAGEILGIGGLVGAGKTEFAKALFGAEQLASGELTLDGEAITVSSEADAIRQGIVYVTEDRKNDGLFLDMTIADNLVAPVLGWFADRLQMLRGSAIETAANAISAEVKVKSTGSEQIVGTLSGGNQQKVLLGRWLQLDPKLLIVDEPTVGVDVSARVEIYRLLRARAERGTAIIFISSELKELMQNTDRIVTMHAGRFTGSFNSAVVSEQELMIAIAGEGGGKP